MNATNNYLSKRDQRDAKRFFLLWLRRLVIFYIIGLLIYFAYLFFALGISIRYTGWIQRNYAKYLIETNDEFVDYMINFNNLTNETNRVYSDSEKKAITLCLEEQNKLLTELQKTSPNEKNTDYIDIYQDMLQTYAFYIQGEIMKAEYCYSYTDNFTIENSSSNGKNIETYTMGDELCNMMGNVILNNYTYINAIRNTSITSKHNIQAVNPDE